MEIEKQPIERLLENAVNAINYLIVCDELSDNYKAIVKLSRFKKWLTEAVSAGSIPVIKEDDNELMDSIQQVDNTESNKHNNPETIKFQ